MANDDTFSFVFECLREGLSDISDKGPVAKLLNTIEKHQLAIRDGYNNTKNYIKSTYMRDKSGPLDRHKCAASFMTAFLENLPVPENNINNELLAIFVGGLILKVFIRKECKNHGDLSLIEFINKSGGFVYPECVCDEEPYEDNWARGIYYDRKANRLSALSLANTLFLIERHNRLLAGN